MASDNSSVKKTIENSYDLIAPRYLSWTQSRPTPRTSYIAKLLSHFPSSPRLRFLELGCGAGIPSTQLLAQRGDVIGVDISSTQIELARANVPTGAEFIKSDMLDLAFAPGSFDAVVAMYSIIHLPRAEQELLMKRVFEWVRPGGWFLGNFGTRDDPGSWAENWLGQKMWWSGWDEEGNRIMIERAGWHLVEGSVISDEEEVGENEVKLVPFLWILGQRNE